MMVLTVAGGRAKKEPRDLLMEWLQRSAAAPERALAPQSTNIVCP